MQCIVLMQKWLKVLGFGKRKSGGVRYRDIKLNGLDTVPAFSLQNMAAQVLPRS